MRNLKETYTSTQLIQKITSDYLLIYANVAEGHYPTINKHITFNHN